MDSESVSVRSHLDGVTPKRRQDAQKSKLSSRSHTAPLRPTHTVCVPAKEPARRPMSELWVSDALP